jgi:hypothetical protein
MLVPERPGDRVKAVTVVVFDDKNGERVVIADALTHIRIAYPMLEQMSDDSPERRAVRALRACASGDTVGAHVLDRAEEGLVALLEACQRESDPAYWVAQDPRVATLRPAHPMAGMAHVLATARRGQVALVEAALKVVRAGQKLATS